MATSTDRYHFVTSPLCKVWEGLLRRAIDSKKGYNDRCKQVEEFYSGMANFMWTPNYMSKFMGGTTGLVPPKFQLTIKKAFEYVAVMKPMLFWQLAARKVIPHEMLELDPMALFGIPELPPDQEPDPQTAAAIEYASSLAGEQAMMNQRNQMRAKLMHCALNYFPREQPGGLSSHINACLDDVLLYGAAFMMTEPYQFPKSDRTLVKSVRVPSKDVFVDPDCTDPLWLSAKWIAIRHEWTYTETEQYFDLPPGSLREYGTRMTTSARWQRGSERSPVEMGESKKDLIEWFEIYSRAGCGNQLTGTRKEIEPEFDEACDGNAAYLCVTWGCPYPLNIPSGKLMGGIFSEAQELGEEPPGAPVEWVQERLRWPTEYWRDDKWPITKLSFYSHTANSIWPEPPLSPAIGELTALNILISAYVQTAYDNRQTIIGVMKGMVENLQHLIDSGKSPLVVEMDPSGQAIFDSVQKIIQFMQRPEINQDVPKTIAFLEHLIEQRTGMSPVLYGESAGANPRSAAEYQGRQNSVNLRPEYMRKCVAEWQSAIADLEMFCAWSHVQSSDLKEQLGPLGMPAWDMLVTNEDPEAILRGAQCIVEASEIARPNKDRDAQMLDRMQQVLVPILAGHLAQHNDPTPLNGFWEAIGEATDIDVSKFLIPMPQPDSESLQMQQAMQQAQLDQANAEVAKTEAETQKIYHELQGGEVEEEVKLQEMQLKQEEATHQMMLREEEANLKKDQAEHQMMLKFHEAELKADAASMQNATKLDSALQQMTLKEKQANQDLLNKERQAAQAARLREDQARHQLALQLWQAKQQARQAEATHQLSMTHADEKAAADARRSNMINASRMMMSGLRSAGS